MFIIGLVDGGKYYKGYIDSLLSTFVSDIKYVEDPETDPDLLIFSDFGEKHMKYNCKKIHIRSEAWEKERKCDLLINCVGPGIYVPHYITSFFERSSIRKDVLFQKKQIVGEKKKFCAFMYAHDVGYRNEFFDLLSKYKRVDALGNCRRNTDSIIDRFDSNFYDTAVEKYRDYKFVIAFENVRKDGYITEKIINPMLSFDEKRPPSIPIYFGAPDIVKHFNPKSFINVSDFATFEDAIEKIKEIDNNDSLYRAMLAEPWLIEDNPNMDDKYVIEKIADLINISPVGQNREVGEIYCINMKEATSRREYVELAESVHKLDITFIEAINGKDEMKNYPTYRKLPGELGCLLSHIKVLRTFVESKHEIAMVFEDDFELNINFRQILEQIFSVWNIEENGLLLLAPFIASWDGVKEVHKINDYCKIYNVTPNVYGALGYILTRKFAQKCLDRLDKIGVQPFELSETAITQMPGALFVSDPIAIEMCTTSSIIPGREQEGKKYWDTFRTRNTYTRQVITELISPKSQEKLKLHIGCGKKFLKGYKHVDVTDFEHIDFKTQIGKLYTMIGDGSVDEIYACHVLEHFDRKKSLEILKQWYSMMKPGSTLRIAVPDFESCCKLYLSQQVSINDIMGLLYGGQRDRYDYHKIAFDEKSLSKILTDIGFTDIKRYNTFEFLPDEFDDYSKAFLPHMDRNGTLMSLNIRATKK